MQHALHKLCGRGTTQRRRRKGLMISADLGLWADPKGRAALALVNAAAAAGSFKTAPPAPAAHWSQRCSLDVSAPAAPCVSGSGQPTQAWRACQGARSLSLPADQRAAAEGSRMLGLLVPVMAAAAAAAVRARTAWRFGRSRRRRRL